MQGGIHSLTQNRSAPPMGSVQYCSDVQSTHEMFDKGEGEFTI